MSKRISFSGLDQPGLFDDIDDAASPSSSPFPPSGVDSRIAEEARKMAMNKGIPLQGELPFGPVVVRPVPNRFMFMSFGSGSSGNCSYIGDSCGGFLIDAGVDPKTVVDGLKRNGIDMAQIRGICITHDHSDHMRYVYSLLRKYRMRLYCTPRTLNGMLRRHSVSRRLKDYQVNIYKEIPFEIGNFTLTAFEVMHDGSDNVGFHVAHDDRAITVATDLGCISPRADHYMRLSDYLVIESNYDSEMLRTGHYPEYLKARIRAANGHMDNRDTADYLVGLAAAGRLKYVFLCHLSQDNNTPETALRCTREALVGAGVSICDAFTGSLAATPDAVRLAALPRFDCSPMCVFRPL